MSRQSRRGQMLALMDQLSLDVVLLRKPANFAWYTNGADNRVDHASPFGVADMVITRDRDFVLASNIEARRMYDEQARGYDVVEYPWYAHAMSALERVVGDARVGSDAPIRSTVDVGGAIPRLRWVLDEEARQRYYSVGRDAEVAVESAAMAILPGMTELEAAAAVAESCTVLNLFCSVILAAADERISTYRHPLATAKRVERRIMLVVCAERGGLCANLTWFVHFEAPDAALRARFEACQRILNRMREEATRPGRQLAEALADCRRFYAEEGFPEEWKLHHQGGMTGYASREVVATPETDVTITVGQAFAWNPSITGAKAEETFLLTEEGPVVLASGKS